MIGRGHARGQAVSPPHGDADRPLDKKPTAFHDPRVRASGRWMAGAMAFTLLADGCATAKKEAPATIAWNTAMDAALADAGKNGRPILLDFYTDW